MFALPQIVSVPVFGPGIDGGIELLWPAAQLAWGLLAVLTVSLLAVLWESRRSIAVGRPRRLDLAGDPLQPESRCPRPAPPTAAARRCAANVSTPLCALRPEVDGMR